MFINFDENRKEIFIAAFFMVVSATWFTFECTKQPFSFPFEPFIGFVPATISLVYYLFFNKNKGSGREPLELNVIPDRLTAGFVGRVKDIKNIHVALFANNRIHCYDNKNRNP